MLDQWEIKPFANVLGIRSVGNEHRAQFLGEQKHFFPDGVDKHNFREIDDEFQSGVTARHECANLLSSFPRESALKSAD
jgi:hypothetical protein